MRQVMKILYSVHSCIKLDIFEADVVKSFNTRTNEDIAQKVFSTLQRFLKQL